MRDIYYVSTARCASDSNCGRSWADAFATIERALAELGQSQGVVEVGPGEYKAPSAGYTLHAEQTLRSAGMGTVRIDAAGVGADTPVINVVGGRSHVRGFWMVRVHGIGIHVTNTQTGSTQNVLIEDMLVGTTGSGAIAYGIGVRPRAGSSDVSEVLLLHCISNGNETTTHMKIGYGGTGNVLDVTNIGGNSQVNKYGIVIAGGSLVSTGLNFQKSAEADIVCEANAMGQIHISGGRSESAYRFLDHTRFAFQDYNGLLIENYTVFALQNTDGQAVITKHGPLRLNNVTLFGQHCPQYVAYVLEGVLPDGDYLRQTEIDGLASEHPYPIGASPYSRPGRIIEAKNVRFVGDVDFQARANRSPERQVRRKNVHENLPFKLGSRYAMEFVVGLESHAGTVTLTPGVVGQIVGLTFEQNGLGGFSYTWPASCAFDAGSAPANVTTPFNRQSCRFMWNGSFWEQWGPVSNVLPPSPQAFTAVTDSFSSGNPFWLSTPSPPIENGPLWEHVPGGGSLGIQSRSGTNVCVCTSVGWVGDAETDERGLLGTNIGGKNAAAVIETGGDGKRDTTISATFRWYAFEGIIARYKDDQTFWAFVIGIEHGISWVYGGGWSHGRFTEGGLRRARVPALTQGSLHTLVVQCTSDGFVVTVDSATTERWPVTDIAKWQRYTKHGIVASDTRVEFTNFSVS